MIKINGTEYETLEVYTYEVSKELEASAETKAKLQEAIEANHVKIAELQKTIEEKNVEITQLKATIDGLKPKPQLILDGTWAGRTVTGTGDVLRLQPPFDLPAGVAHFFNNSGRPAYAFQRIEDNVLHAEVIQQDPTISAVTRAQLTLEFNQQQGERQVYHFSNKMHLSPDFTELEKYTKAINWFDLMEWRQVSSFDVAMRWLFSIYKDASGKPYWGLHCEQMKPNWITHWQVFNKQFPVEFGKDFVLETYFKKGQGSNGRFIVKIDDKVLFDVNNHTIFPNRPEIWTRQVQVQKLYIANEVKDWLRARGKKMWAKYYDLKWYA